MSNAAEGIAFVVGLLVGAFVVALVIGLTCGTGPQVRMEAIDHNCAEWRIDAKTGEREFVWLGKALIEKEVEGE